MGRSRRDDRTKSSGRRNEGTRDKQPYEKGENNVIDLGTQGPTVSTHGGTSDPI